MTSLIDAAHAMASEMRSEADTIETIESRRQVPDTCILRSATRLRGMADDLDRAARRGR